MSSVASGSPRPPGHGDARPRGRPLIAVSEEDLGWLDHAILLGRLGWGRVHPNPMVGCVLVKRGRVISEGWHREYGGPHAEVGALERAIEDPAASTAYVSLEPCRHQGKTPACTDALIEAGVARVVFAVADPGKKAGGGGAALRAAGVRAEGPVWPESAGRRENPIFFHRIRSGRPFVAVKLALSLDGQIAEAPGLRTSVTGPEALQEAHQLRAGFDAVMVGAVTARVDDPRLTVRDAGVVPRIPPARVVLDSEGSIPPDAAIFREPREGGGRVIVFVGEGAAAGNIAALEGAGAEVRPVARGPRGLDLAAVLDTAAARGIHSILCEGGGQLTGSFLAAGLVDRLYLFQSPRVLGSGGVPAFPEPLDADFWMRWSPAFDPEPLGEDVLTVYERGR